MVGAGRLHEARQLTQQAIQLGRQPGSPPLLDVCLPMIWQGNILHEWNQSEAALSLVKEGISLGQQFEALPSLAYLLIGYAVLLHIQLSCGELEAASSALQEFERFNMRLNRPISLHFRSIYITVDQVRLWLARGELDLATHWVDELDLAAPHGTPLARECEEVARVHILLAKDQPTLALKRLKPVIERATAGQRWGHVIEMRLLQALAYQMGGQEKQALSTLSEALRLAEPEGFIRSFVDEGASMKALLSKLQKECSAAGPTPYLDTLLAAFPPQSKAQKRQPKQARQRPKRSHTDADD